MKILFVHEVSWFDKVVFEMHDIPELLSLRGHDVFFLDYDEQGRRTLLRIRTAVESRAHNNSRVVVSTPPRLLPGILGRLLATVIQPLSFLLLIKKIRPDVVVIYSVPTSGWQITAICRRRGIPVVARIIDAPHALRQTRFKGLIKLTEKYIFSRVNAVSTHNEVLREYCISLGSRPQKTSLIMPGVDIQRFRPVKPRIDLQSALGISSTNKVIVFMGTLFRFSGLIELIDELSIWLARDSELLLLVLGDGELFDEIQQHTKTLEIHRQVRLVGRVGYEELADYLRLGQVAVLPFQKKLVTHLALPAKIFQYLSCGLPTISTPLNGLQSIVADGNGVLYADSYRDMARMAVELLEQPERREDISLNGLKLIADECNWNNQIQLFEQLLSDVVDAK